MRAVGGGANPKVGAAGSSFRPSPATSGKGKAKSVAGNPAPPSPEELARRRETMAAAAEARMKSLMQQSHSQQLW